MAASWRELQSMASSGCHAQRHICVASPGPSNWRPSYQGPWLKHFPKKDSTNTSLWGLWLGCSSMCQYLSSLALPIPSCWVHREAEESFVLGSSALKRKPYLCCIHLTLTWCHYRGQNGAHSYMHMHSHSKWIKHDCYFQFGLLF